VKGKKPREFTENFRTASPTRVFYKSKKNPVLLKGRGEFEKRVGGEAGVERKPATRSHSIEQQVWELKEDERNEKKKPNMAKSAVRGGK